MTEHNDPREHIARLGEPDATDLPPMQSAILDEPTLAALVRDLNQCAHINEVLVKGGPQTQTDAQQIKLDDAVLKLLNGELRGVQIRYRHEGQPWCDTLMRTNEGIRLVRVQQQV